MSCHYSAAILSVNSDVVLCFAIGTAMDVDRCSIDWTFFRKLQLLLHAEPGRQTQCGMSESKSCSIQRLLPLERQHHAHSACWLEACPRPAVAQTGRKQRQEKRVTDKPAQHALACLCAGTVIAAGQSLYLSPNVTALRARGSSPTGKQGLQVQGSYSPSLSSGANVQLTDASGNTLSSMSG